MSVAVADGETFCDPDVRDFGPVPSARNSTGWRGVQRVGKQFKALRTEQYSIHYLGLYPTAEAAAQALASDLRGEEVEVSNMTVRGEREAPNMSAEREWVPVFTRARRMGVQLPPTPELVAKHCKRYFDNDGEQEGWELPDGWDLVLKGRAQLSDAECKQVFKKLAAYKKACAQKVRREEMKCDPDWHAREKASDRERKRKCI